jgi:hypothetical protein
MSATPAPGEQRVVDRVPKQPYIGGKRRDGSKDTLPVEDPSTGESQARRSTQRSSGGRS